MLELTQQRARHRSEAAQERWDLTEGRNVRAQGVRKSNTPPERGRKADGAVPGETSAAAVCRLAGDLLHEVNRARASHPFGRVRLARKGASLQPDAIAWSKG